MLNSIHEILHQILNQITNIIASLGYWGIGIGMFLESACIPLPSELVLPLGGIMVHSGKLTMLGANLTVNIGSLLGSLAAYTIGFLGGRPFILKHGNRFFVSQKHFYAAEKTFNKFGASAVLIGRLLPIIRTFISLPAGISKMNIHKFILYSIIGMIPWNFALIYLGFKFNEQFNTIISPIYHRFEYIIIGTVILIVAAIIIKSIFTRLKKKSSLQRNNPPKAD